MGNIFSPIRNKIATDFKARMLKSDEQPNDNNDNQLKPYLVTLGILACILLYFGLNDIYESDKLSKHGVETYATVYDVRIRVKPSGFITKCKFLIGGKEYQVKYTLNRPLEYGDTLQVLYYPENPKINRLIIPDSLNINNRVKD